MKMNNTTTDLRSLQQIVSFDIDLENSVNLLYNPDPVLIALYVPLIVTSLLANILLITIVFKHNLCKKNVTNIYLVNLSVADLLVTSLCMPIQLSKAFTLVWFYGEIVCKLVNYLQGVAVAASVFTIAAMSVDRYLAISPARNLRSLSKKASVRLLATVWLVALLTFTPLLIVANVQSVSMPVFIRTANNSIIEEQTVNFCVEDWVQTSNKTLFGIFSFTMICVLPGTIMMLSYAFMGRTLCSVKFPYDDAKGNISRQGIRLMKERKRLAWVLLLVAGLFAACWLPYNILLLLLDMNSVSTYDVSGLLPYMLLLGHMNSALNPIVYCLMTKNFQTAARTLICGNCRCARGGRELSSSDYDAYHELHKRCYLQMHDVGHAHQQIDTRIPTSYSCAVTRSSRRVMHAQAYETLKRHGLTRLSFEPCAR